MSGKAPLIVFSHGFSGRNTQSLSLMRALAGHGYLVIAPNHRDAGALLHGLKPQIDFKEPEKWSDKTYADRRDDIGKLIDALHRDPSWNDCIDWNALGLCGHSLGGYTVLGLAGAWPSWRLNGVKAVLALSPYAAPYAISGDLNGINLPVMYQGGSRDFGLTPTLKKVDGIFDKTSKPAYFVDFSQAGHFAWTNFNHNKSQEELINYYSLAFFDKHLKSAATADPIIEKDGVIELRCK
jgi:predicted dienelactone hydrolase